jgi:hypothetical protein
MPYIRHVKSVTTFNLGPPAAPVETASCTLSWSPTVIETLSQQAQADAWYADWAAWVSGADSQVQSNVSLQGVKVCVIGTDGRMEGDPYQKLSTGTAPVGVGTTNQHPLQTSLALTLVCGAAGKGRLGRIFLPPISFVLDSGGLLTSSQHGAIFAPLQTLMAALSAHVDTGLDLHLAVAGTTGTGTLRPVTSLRLGKAPDTQRRRRRNLDEAYVTAAFSG